jgi:hypothetical protein
MSGTFVSYSTTGGGSYYFNMNSTNFNAGSYSTFSSAYAIKANVGVTTSLSVGTP